MSWAGNVEVGELGFFDALTIASSLRRLLTSLRP